ncbi:DUF6941 family protein [Aeribacillus alveayuensis]|uniref:Uncharacterized protein n=1 Tax=Aeribacillus alveayuensis TaxID=279215 RepID=A0ABT9VM15_9BACI|nr:hypothetical protein [Bacillus alveayuensis]
MPKISTFMYCDRAELNPQGQMHITNPLLVMNPVFVPGMYSFSVVFGVQGLDNESDHTLRVLFLSPNENEPPLIDTNTISLPKGTAPKIMISLPPEQKGMMFNMDFRNVVFKTEGTYKTRVYFDGENLGDYPIYVKAGEER